MLNNISQVESKPYDVCVIGGGIAGIIVALEHSKLRPDSRILLLECGSGKTEKNPLDDTIDVRPPDNHHMPYECTNKGLGGSSKTWGGRCVMYDEIDFVPHGPVGDECTWDESFLEEVKPYMERASEYLHSGKPNFTLSSEKYEDVGPIAEHFVRGAVTDDAVERWSLPTRFGKEYSEQLKTSGQIEILEGGVAKEFVANAENNATDLLICLTASEDSKARVRSTHYVVCAGGQESTRLLLSSPWLFRDASRFPFSLGRYYQGHVSGKIAHIRFYGDPEKTNYGFIRDDEGIFCRRRFQFTKQALKDHRMMNTAFWLDNPPFYDPAHRNGTLSLIYLMMTLPVLRKKLLPPAIARSITGGGAASILPHLINVVRGLPSSILRPASIFYRRYLRRRSLPGVFLKSQANRYALHFHAEQMPLAENRMTLTEDKLRLNIRFRYCDKDIDSVLRAHDTLDQELRKMKCGEIEYLYPLNELPEKIREISMDGLHQVGTTRISDDPETGVVDRNLRVWGHDSVFVCSSSSFPTSGQANPTLLLATCSVRLAHYLASQNLPRQ